MKKTNLRQKTARKCTGQVAGAGADLLGDLLQVEQRAPTAGAAHVLRLDVAHPRALQYGDVRGWRVLVCFRAPAFGQLTYSVSMLRIRAPAVCKKLESSGMFQRARIRAAHVLRVDVARPRALQDDDLEISSAGAKFIRWVRSQLRRAARPVLIIARPHALRERIRDWPQYAECCGRPKNLTCTENRSCCGQPLPARPRNGCRL